MTTSSPSSFRCHQRHASTTPGLNPNPENEPPRDFVGTPFLVRMEQCQAMGSTRTTAGCGPHLGKDSLRVGLRRVDRRRALADDRRLAGVGLAAVESGDRRARDSCVQSTPCRCEPVTPQVSQRSENPAIVGSLLAAAR